MGVELRRRRKKTGVVVPIDGSAPAYNFRGPDVWYRNNPAFMTNRSHGERVPFSGVA